jgi:16S rRNA (adenine1518-N6/adenine1519-N6)-dimethyltransferase
MLLPGKSQPVVGGHGAVSRKPLHKLSTFEYNWAKKGSFFMDLTDITDIKKTLKAFGAHTKKDLGQHFLIDEKALDRIVDAADINKSDVIVEVGPGMGILTRELCKEASQVIAVELDKTMLSVVKTACIKHANLRVENQDILKFETNKLKSYKVVSNLPYYITSPTIRMFLEADNKPEEMVLLVQREVAERIAAKPGRMSILAVSVQYYGDPSIISIVPRTSFFPAPKVDSAILKIKVYKKPIFDVDKKVFFRIVRSGFSVKRKQLINSLSGGLGITRLETEKWLGKTGIDPQMRAEALSMTEWHNLYRSYQELFSEKS